MIPRVLFVGRTRYRLPLQPGLARKWDALSERMTVRVLASGSGRDPRFHLVRERPLDGPSFYTALPWIVAGELRSFRPDVVIAESAVEAAAVEIARRATRSRARVVAEVHGDWHVWSSYGSRFRALLGPASNAVAGWALDRADGHRAVSGFTASLLEARGRSPLGTFVTYSDLSAFSAPLQPVPSTRRVVFVGVMERYKNIEGLAAAWDLVSERVPDARLHLVGQGTLMSVAESLAAGGATWDKRLEPSEVARAIDDSRALMLPSLSEGLPRVAVEAFLRGRAVVGARTGGIPDIVEDGVNGLLVESGDSLALAAAIERILTDDELAVRLGAAAAEASVRWHATPDEYADRVRAVVDAVLSGQGGR